MLKIKHILPVLKNYLELLRGLNTIKKIHKSNPTISNKITVCLNTVNYQQIVTFMFETIIAAYLRKKGVNVIQLIDDSILLHNETDSIENILKNKRRSYRSRIYLPVIKYFGFHMLYSDLINRDALENELKIILKKQWPDNIGRYKDIDVFEHIRASIVQLQKSALGYENKINNYNIFLDICVRNAMISLIIAESVENKYHPDIIFTSHGIYSTYGPFSQFFKNLGRKVITRSFADYNPGSVVLAKDGLAANRQADNSFNHLKNKIDFRVAKEFADKKMEERVSYSSPDQEILFMNKQSKKIMDLLPIAILYSLGFCTQ